MDRLRPFDFKDSQFWVYVKPAAFYQALEARSRRNAVFLKRCLSYASGSDRKRRRRTDNGVAVDVELADCSPVGFSRGGKKLSVVVALCEVVSAKEFCPKLVKLAQLDCSQEGKNDQQPANPTRVSLPLVVPPKKGVVLFLIREAHPDLSGLRGDRCCHLTTELSKKTVFGILPVGKHVWWASARFELSTTCSTQITLERGIVTVAELTVWGAQPQQTRQLLCLEPAMGSDKSAPSLTASIAINGGPAEQQPNGVVPSQSVADSAWMSDQRVPNEDFNCVQGAPRPGTMGGESRDADHAMEFRYVFHNNSRALQETTYHFTCPFCHLQCKDFQGANRHLVASHDLFNYNLEPDNPQTFWVTCRQDVFDKNGDIYCPETRQMLPSNQKAFVFVRPSSMSSHRHNLQISGSTADDATTSEFASQRLLQNGAQDLGQGVQRGLATRARRSSYVRKRTGTTRCARRYFQPHELCQTYYHSRTAIRMTQEEVEEGMDTDEEEDSQAWELKLRRDLGQKVFLSEDEREFMFRWNTFVRQPHLLTADFKTPSACRKFVAAHTEFLQRPAIRRTLVLHLINMWNLHLIDGETIVDVLKVVDGDGGGGGGMEGARCPNPRGLENACAMAWRGGKSGIGRRSPSRRASGSTAIRSRKRPSSADLGMDRLQ